MLWPDLSTVIGWCLQEAFATSCLLYARWLYTLSRASGGSPTDSIDGTPY